MGLPYRTILTIACVVLAGRYGLDPTGSVMGRWIVGLATVASFAGPDALPWSIAAIVTQLAISLFVLLRAAANRA